MMAAAGDVKTGAMAVRADQGDFYYKKRCVCVCAEWTGFLWAPLPVRWRRPAITDALYPSTNVFSTDYLNY